MSDTKKYYWLKLKRDFFKRHDIKIIESMDNGKDYVLFYLKLLLESVDHDGTLRFSETIPYNESMLATITDTNIDTVRSAVKIFSELGMMDRFDDGTLYMAQVENMLGSETSDAVRMRELRDKKKQLYIEHGESEQCSEPFKNRSPEIEIELDIEKDKELRDTPDEPAITPKPLKVEKHKHGEYNHVLLSSVEYLKLVEEWGEPELLRMIKELDEGIETKGYRYKNCNLAIRKWKKDSKGRAIPKPYSVQSKKECPRCGSSIEFGQCTSCGIFVGVDGKEVVL